MRENTLQSKKRVRDGWTNLNDHPHLQPTNPDDENSPSKDMLKVESSLMRFPNEEGQLSYRNSSQMRDELRQETEYSREIGKQRRSNDGKRDDNATTKDGGDEIGFEIEMDGSLSNELSSSSSSSSLVFSVSKVSNSETAPRDLVEGDHLWESSGVGKEKMVAGGRYTMSSRARRRPGQEQSFSIEIDKYVPYPTSNIQSATPRANNRSTVPHPIYANRRPTQSAVSYSRKKKYSFAPLGFVSSLIEKETDENSNGSPTTHPSLEDSAPRSYPREKDIGTDHQAPIRQRRTPSPPVDQAFMPQRNPTSPISVCTSYPSLEDSHSNVSIHTHPSLEDSTHDSDAEAQELDETKKAKGDSGNSAHFSYAEAQEVDETKQAKGDLTLSVSSEGIDGRWWDDWKEKLLSVDTQSPTNQGLAIGYWERERDSMPSFTSQSSLALKSLSDDMENCLIQDCIDTGLPPTPSPQMKEEQESKVPSVMPQREISADFLLPVHPEKTSSMGNTTESPELKNCLPENTIKSPVIKRAEAEHSTHKASGPKTTSTEQTQTLLSDKKEKYNSVSSAEEGKTEIDSGTVEARTPSNISRKVPLPKDSLHVDESHRITKAKGATEALNKSAPKVEGTDARSLASQNKCMQDTTIEAVSSGLTADFDEEVSEKAKNTSGYSIISDIEVGDITNNIQQKISSCSESEVITTAPGIDLVISDDPSDQSDLTLNSEQIGKQEKPYSPALIANIKPGTPLSIHGFPIHDNTIPGDNFNKQKSKNSGEQAKIALDQGNKKIEATNKTRILRKFRDDRDEQNATPAGPTIEVSLITSSSGENSETKMDGSDLQKKPGDKAKVPATFPCHNSLFSDLTDLNTTASTIESEDKILAQRSAPTLSCSGLEQHIQSDTCEARKTGDVKETCQAAAATMREITNEKGAASNPIGNEPSKTAFDRNTGTAIKEERTDEKIQMEDRVPSGATMKLDAEPRPLPMDRLRITGRNEFKDLKDGARQHRKETVEEGETAIINVTSTLTNDTQSKHGRTTAKSAAVASLAAPSEVISVLAAPSIATSTPVLRKSSKSVRNKENGEVDENNSNPDLSVGFKDTKSFDTKVSASAEGVPSWRLDPSESLSNFAINILNHENGKVNTYNVHKHIVAVGSRRSEYFDSLFRSSSQQSVELALDSKALNILPAVLDYMYCHDVEIQISTDTALAYRTIALKLKIVPLLVNAAGFILRDVRTETMGTYIEQAIGLKDERILELLVARCAATIEEFDVTDPMWTVIDPDLFLQLISHPSIDRKKLSAHLSILVTEYQTMHKYEVDCANFEILTAEQLLPTIDRSAALPLLEICEEYGCPEEFQPLQQRCAHVMACYWKITSEGDRRRVFALLRGLPSNFTVDFLETIEVGKSATIVKTAALRNSEPKISDNEIVTFTLGSLCDELVGQDGYSIESSNSLPLCWRGEATKTYSDWKIKVKHHGTDIVDMYDVHKHVLSIGAYKSNFFADVFLSESHTRTRRGITTIELAHAAAVLVPAMLDFIYSPDHKLNASKRTAVALRFLARVFGVWMLNKNILEFVVHDMTLDNVLEYIQEAETFDDEKITMMAVRLCVQKIQLIKVDSPLLMAMKPDFFGRVVSSSEIAKCANCHVSILIAKYFTLHDLSETLLGQLLPLFEMTELDSISALELLKIIASLKSKETEIFKKLRQRCAEIISENWNDLRENNRQEMFEVFRNLESSILVDIFDKVEAFYNEQQAQTMTLQVKLVKRYRKQLADARTLREDEILQLNKEKDDKIEELLLAKKDLEAKLQQTNEESTRRNVRSTGAYNNPSPSSRARALANSRRKSSIPKFSQKAKAVLASGKAKSNLRKTTAAPEPASFKKNQALSRTAAKATESVARTSPKTTPLLTPQTEATVEKLGESPTAAVVTSSQVLAIKSPALEQETVEVDKESEESALESLAEARKSAMQSIASPAKQASPAGSLFGFSFFSCAATSVTHSSDSGGFT